MSVGVARGYDIRQEKAVRRCAFVSIEQRELTLRSVAFALPAASSLAGLLELTDFTVPPGGCTLPIDPERLAGKRKEAGHYSGLIQQHQHFTLMHYHQQRQHTASAGFRLSPVVVTDAKFAEPPPVSPLPET